MKKLLLITVVILISRMPTAEAHSGCCSSHGGVKGCGCADGTSLSTTCAPYYPQCNTRRASKTMNSSSGISTPKQTSKTTQCAIRGALQDATCTPGAVFPNATKAVICVSGYTQTVRDVPTATKDKIFAAYGITSHNGSTYEVDHLIPLELGGSNDIANLWPEAANPGPGFHDKDKLENRLHALVCNGSLPLKDAQNGIATDWLSFFHRFFP